MPRLPDADTAGERDRADLRMPVLGASAWLGGLAALTLPWWVGAAALASGVLFAVSARRCPWVRAVVACVLVAAAVGGSALLREAMVAESPVAELAAERAVARMAVTITSDPRTKRGQFSEYVVVRARTHEVLGRGSVHRVGVPVLIIGDPAWREVELGSTVRLLGRLAPADDHHLAAVISARSDPELVAGPSPLWRGSAAVRASIRESVAHTPEAPRALVPALVAGDDQDLPEDVVADFQTAGLTHLLAVSGTNLTLIVGFLLIVARWVGVRRRGLYVVGAVGIVGFVLLARTEPSVVRAAAMGTCALIAMGSNGRERGTRALGCAVLGLLLLDPWLATSAGFALSVLATAGILFLGPAWRDAFARWLPRWLAEALAVPLAAQVVCTPLVAVLSGEVSLVAVVANLLVAPAVGPATVLGVVAGLLGLAVADLGRLVGTAAGWSASWIAAVADVCAALPGASMGWASGPWAVVGLVAICTATVLLGPRLLARPAAGAACCVLLAVVLLAEMPTPGWPPSRWVLVACDVGQGDGLAINAGGGAAVVVDVGPEPGSMDDCLRRLGVDTIPLLVLTHFHADHVAGLSGVLDGRRVGEIDVTSLREPADTAAAVARQSAGTAVVERVPGYGETRRIGDLTIQVIAPAARAAAGTGDDEGSRANNASLVLLVEVRGLRLLLTGDAEPEAQAALGAALPGLTVDVLKVPHHGSRYQDYDFLVGLRSRLALVSVGPDNDYGHPAPELVDTLEAAGTDVLRTDQRGDLVVVEKGGELRVVTER
jgi:competence protein ComEC